MSNILLCNSPKKDNNNRLFNVVIPTYKGGKKLEVIINCLLAQTSQNFNITIISDGEEKETEMQMRKYYDIDNFNYYHTAQRYNNFGHTPRQLGMLNSTCRFTIMSGFDNYYVPIFIERFERAAQSTSNVGFIFCDFVLDHPRDGRKYNGYINSKLEVNYIDIGNFAAETSLLKRVEFKVNEYAADWHLVKDMLPLLEKERKTIIKIPQTLYVHN